MESSEYGRFLKRSKDQGLFRRQSKDQGGLRATISMIKYFSWLIFNDILPHSDSLTSGWSIWGLDHSPHSGVNYGLGTRLVRARDFSRPCLPYRLRHACPLRPRLGRLFLTGTAPISYRLLGTSGGLHEWLYVNTSTAVVSMAIRVLVRLFFVVIVLNLLVIVLVSLLKWKWPY